jgi:hypothetical protein
LPLTKPLTNKSEVIINHHAYSKDNQHRFSSRSGWLAVLLVLVLNQASELAWGFDVMKQPISRTGMGMGVASRSARWKNKTTTTTTTTTTLHLKVMDTLSPTTREKEKEETLLLPQWLASQRSRSSTSTLQQQQEQLQEELQWLQWTLMDRQLPEEVVEEILHTIHVACRGNVEWVLGCIDFLQTLLRQEQVAAPTVILASIIHYVECVAARTEGVYDTVQQRLTLNYLEHISEHRLALPPSSVLQEERDEQEEIPRDSISQSGKSRPKQRRGPTSLKHKESLIPSSLTPQDENSFSSSLASPLTPEVLQISNGASQIKRAEIVAEVVLPRQADYEKVQNLLVSVSGDDWRALAIRCVASLYRLEGALQTTRHQQDRHPQTIATARSAIHVYAPLAQRMGLHVLKTQLESKAL